MSDAEVLHKFDFTMELRQSLELTESEFFDKYGAPAIRDLTDEMKRNEKLSPEEMVIAENVLGLPHDPNREFIVLPPTE